MKYIIRILLILISAALIWLCIPKSCTTNPGEMEQKAIHSLKVDSIQTAITNRINAKNDSIVKAYKDSLQQLKSKTEVLSSKYYALRATVSKQKAVRIDSSTQIIEVPAIEYNASVNSGNMCDSLLMYQDQELAIKDSIISCREIQLTAAQKEITTKEQALQDLIALNKQREAESEKAHKINKRIPLIATLSAFAGSILTIILLK